MFVYVVVYALWINLYNENHIKNLGQLWESNEKWKPQVEGL